MNTTRTLDACLRSIPASFFCGRAFILLVAGCTSVTPVSETKYPKTDPAKVEVLYEMPQRPHEVIGLIAYSGGHGIFADDTKHLIQHCKEEAAQLGADAVIIGGVFQGGVFAPERRSSVSAKAIKWK